MVLLGFLRIWATILHFFISIGDSRRLRRALFRFAGLLWRHGHWEAIGSIVRHFALTSISPHTIDERLKLSSHTLERALRVSYVLLRFVVAIELARERIIGPLTSTDPFASRSKSDSSCLVAMERLLSVRSEKVAFICLEMKLRTGRVEFGSLRKQSFGKRVGEKRRRDGDVR